MPTISEAIQPVASLKKHEVIGNEIEELESTVRMFEDLLNRIHDNPPEADKQAQAAGVSLALFLAEDAGCRIQKCSLRLRELLKELGNALF